MKIIEQIETSFWEKARVVDTPSGADPRHLIGIACLALACVICALSWVNLRRETVTSGKDRLSSQFHGERGLNAAYQLMGR